MSATVAVNESIPAISQLMMAAAPAMGIQPLVQRLVQPLAAGPVSLQRTAPVTLTDSGIIDIGGKVTQVQFWIAPAGASGLDTATDTLLGVGVEQTDGDWVLKLRNLDAFMPDDYVIFSRALDGDGNWSEAVSQDVPVV